MSVYGSGGRSSALLSALFPRRLIGISLAVPLPWCPPRGNRAEMAGGGEKATSAEDFERTDYSTPDSDGNLRVKVICLGDSAVGKSK